jgi:VanZ family protein
LSVTRFISLWTPVALFMALIYFVSGRSLSGVPVQGWDKGVHIVAYLVLGLLCLRASHGRIGSVRLRPTLVAVALGLAYGISDEWHQSLVPGRDPSIADWFADATGILLAVACTAMLGAVRSRRTRDASKPGP